MDLYHIWFNLKPGSRDSDFADRVHAYLGRLRNDGAIADYRLTRRKLGLGPSHLPEFHIVVEFDGLAQMDEAFSAAAARTQPIEGLHQAVNSMVSDASFALYRDFPDAIRQRGEEAF